MIKILKFGGSSLANKETIQAVAKIILTAKQNAEVIVVVSAFQHVTNDLLECAALAARNDMTVFSAYQRIKERHLKTAQALGCTVNLDHHFEQLHEMLQAVTTLRDCSLRSFDAIASYGELLSATIVADYLNHHYPAQFIDARQIIVTDDSHTEAKVLFNETNSAIQTFFTPFLKEKSPIPVVTGFIGATLQGQTTTIGRNGSDYSAAIIGAALPANIIEIWTDVDGIFSADPRIVTKAIVISHLSYEEAMELSHFGAKVLHPASVAPAIHNNIPILIKNTFNPETSGTLISKQTYPSKNLIKGISAIHDVILFTLRGLQMMGGSSIIERIFRSLTKNNINIILISQASSEHTLCFAVAQKEAKLAEHALNKEFHYEMDNQLIKLEKTLQQTIISVVGENMIGTPGIAGKFCYALGENKISINAIAQGASERNISLSINSTDATLALHAVHQFFFETHKKLALCIIGVGNVGDALITLLKQQSKILFDKGYDVSIIAMANSKKLLFDLKGIDLDHWQTALSQATLPFSIEIVLQHLKSATLTHVALIDCTASSDIVAHYSNFINNNFHIITPNKKANVLPWTQYQNLMTLIKERQRHFLFEANVGAGLPIISTLEDLLLGGDTIRRIEGIFSGTLSYLFNHYDGTKPFSHVIKEAHQNGLTEPDPREDLSGNDVARKLLILARQLGQHREFQDIAIENLVPIELREGSVEHFYLGLKKLDELIDQQWKKASQNNSVLRYVGTLNEEGASASLKIIPKDHPLAFSKGSDNIIAFTTERYSQSPLVIQGPGAGGTVTAMGIFSDMIKLLHYLPY